MSLWDWLLAAWIYEELFDNSSDNTSHDNTHDYDSSYDYDDYDEDLWFCIPLHTNNSRIWIYYNNKVLSAQEREEFRIRAEETIEIFTESIDGFCELYQEYKPSQNKVHDKITKTVLDVGIFTCYTYCDCTVLLKHFILSTDLYEKRLFRGKLKVLLNEGFKSLYGFNDKQCKRSYYIKLGEIMNYFPGFQLEYDSILLKLKQLSE